MFVFHIIFNKNNPQIFHIGIPPTTHNSGSSKFSWKLVGSFQQYKILKFMYILMPETEGFAFDCRGDEIKEKIL